MPTGQLFRTHEQSDTSATSRSFPTIPPFPVPVQACATKKSSHQYNIFRKPQPSRKTALFTCQNKNRIIRRPEQRRSPQAIFSTVQTRKNRHKSGTSHFHLGYRQAIPPLSIVQAVFSRNRDAIPAICRNPASANFPWRHPSHEKNRHDPRKAEKTRFWRAVSRHARPFPHNSRYSFPYRIRSSPADRLQPSQKESYPSAVPQDGCTTTFHEHRDASVSAKNARTRNRTNMHTPHRTFWLFP